MEGDGTEILSHRTNYKNNDFNKNQIEIYKDRNAQIFSKRNEHILSYNSTFCNKDEKNGFKDENSLYFKRRRGYSQNIKRETTTTDLIINDIDSNNDYYDKIGNSNRKWLKSRSSKYENYKYKFKKRFIRKKIVTFKTKFVTIIEVESFKKYNINENLFNNNVDTICSCEIY